MQPVAKDVGLDRTSRIGQRHGEAAFRHRSQAPAAHAGLPASLLDALDEREGPVRAERPAADDVHRPRSEERGAEDAVADRRACEEVLGREPGRSRLGRPEAGNGNAARGRKKQRGEAKRERTPKRRHGARPRPDARSATAFGGADPLRPLDHIGGAHALPTDHRTALFDWQAEDGRAGGCTARFQDSGAPAPKRIVPSTLGVGQRSPGDVFRRARTPGQDAARRPTPSATPTSPTCHPSSARRSKRRRASASTTRRRRTNSRSPGRPSTIRKRTRRARRGSWTGSRSTHTWTGNS